MSSTHEVSEINMNQFLSSFKMLKKLIEICPNHVWIRYFNEVPFWYQVYHTVYFIDYWIGNRHDNPFVPIMDIGQDIPPEFETDIKEDILISQAVMLKYMELLEEKIHLFFTNLKDADLGKPVIHGAINYTIMDAIICQNRHIMYNVGYLNGILRSLGLPESDWWAYNE